MGGGAGRWPATTVVSGLGFASRDRRGPVVLCRAGHVGAQPGSQGARAAVPGLHTPRKRPRLVEDLEQPPPGRAHAHAAPSAGSQLPSPPGRASRVEGGRKRAQRPPSCSTHANS